MYIPNPAPSALPAELLATAIIATLAVTRRHKLKRRKNGNFAHTFRSRLLLQLLRYRNYGRNSGRTGAYIIYWIFAGLLAGIIFSTSILLGSIVLGTALLLFLLLLNS